MMGKQKESSHIQIITKLNNNDNNKSVSLCFTVVISFKICHGKHLLHLKIYLEINNY